MTIGADFELCQLFHSRCGGQDLASVFIEVDHVEHNLTGLFLVGHLHEKGVIVRLHTSVLINGWVVRLPVLSFGIAPVKNSADGTERSIVEVQSRVSQITGHPAPVDKNSLFSSIAIQVRVEGSDNIDTLLSVAHLFDLHLTRMVKDALDNDRLHGPIILELIKLVRLF